MKIKRIFAPEMRQAIRLVREALGPDAVILSNRNVDGGIEIVAALDLDAQMIETKCQSQGGEGRDGPQTANAAGCTGGSVLKGPSDRFTESFGKSVPDAAKNAPARLSADAGGESSRRGEASADQILLEMRKELKWMRELLNECLSNSILMPLSSDRTATGSAAELAGLGFSAALAADIAGRFDGRGEAGGALKKALELIADRLPVTRDDPLAAGGVVALVGPTGVGKTTTLAKLAARYVLRHGRGGLGLVTVDSYRIAAHEHLKTYGRLFDAPVRAASGADELARVLDDFRSKRLVLIDTAGMSQRDARLAEQSAMLRDGGVPIEFYLTISAATQARAMAQVIQAFSSYEPKACILTKLDETASYGVAVSALIEHRLPLAYICNGQRVPEDLHFARPQEILALCGFEAGQAMETFMETGSNENRMAQAYA